MRTIRPGKLSILREPKIEHIILLPCLVCAKGLHRLITAAQIDPGMIVREPDTEDNAA